MSVFTPNCSHWFKGSSCPNISNSTHSDTYWEYLKMCTTCNSWPDCDHHCVLGEAVCWGPSVLAHSCWDARPPGLTVVWPWPISVASLLQLIRPRWLQCDYSRPLTLWDWKLFCLLLASCSATQCISVMWALETRGLVLPCSLSYTVINILSKFWPIESHLLAPMELLQATCLLA